MRLSKTVMCLSKAVMYLSKAVMCLSKVVRCLSQACHVAVQVLGCIPQVVQKSQVKLMLPSLGLKWTWKCSVQCVETA